MTKGAAGANYPETQPAELLTVRPAHAAMLGEAKPKENVLQTDESL